MKDVSITQWKQANEAYKKLLDLTVGDAIAQLNGMDDLSDEVKSLVLALISSGNQSSQFFAQEIGDSFQNPAATMNQLEIGDRLDQYEIESHLGHGGMASVYQAKRVSAEKQKSVAIKLFDRSQLTPVLLNRFAVEQDVLSGLSHPNIVNMHHGGSSEGGAPYIVMDLIDGAQDIDVFCRTEKLKHSAVVRLVLTAANAIAYAHQNLIVHRDIKPSNLLIDSNKQLKVVDFGIAKLMGQPDAPHKTTILALTPSFAAPEQINSGQIAVTTDVFSLAAVLLSLLVKKLPLPEDRLLKSCVGDELHISQLLKAEIKDKDLRNILNQALQQNPQKRYRSMDLFAEDLAAWLDQKPVKATPDSFGYRVSKFAQRRRALFAALSTLAVMLVLGVAVLSWQVEKTRNEAQKANEVRDFMLNVFSYADPNENIAQKLSALDLLALAEDEMQFQQFADTNTQADILSAIGTAYSNLGNWDKGYEILEKVVKLNPDDVTSRLKLAEIHLNKSEPELAAEIIETIEENTSIDFNQVSLLAADYWLVRSLVDFFAVDSSKSLVYAQKAKSMYSKLQNLNGVLKSSRVIAERYVNQSDARNGLIEAQKTLQMLQNKVSAVNTEVLRLKTTEIYLHTQLGEYDAAKQRAGNLIKDIENVLGKSHPALIDALVQRALVLRNTGDLTGSMNDAQASYEIAVTVFGESSQMAQQALSISAQNHFAMGAREEALNQIRKVVELSSINYGESHRKTLEAKNEYANYLGANGMVEEAIEMAQFVYDKQVMDSGVDDYKSIFAANTLLKLLSMRTQLDDKTLQLAIENNLRAVANLEPQHPQVAYSYFVLGGAYTKLEQYEKANATFISIIENGFVRNDNPRFLALSQSIAQNYQLAGNTEQALTYALQNWQAATNLMGAEAVRTVKSRLRLMAMMSSEGADYQAHLVALQDMVASKKIVDEDLIRQISSL